MKNYMAANKATIFPLGIAGAVMSLIMTTALFFSEVSPSAIF